MQTIDINELKILKPNFSEGHFSNIHIVTYQNMEYCFKVFKMIYPTQIIENIGNLTEKDFSKEFLTPTDIVTKKGKYIGYLTHFNNENKVITDIKLNYNQKILLLKDAKKKIEKLHNDYKIIHGDLSVYNILCDNKLNTSIIDFDASLYFDQIIGNSISLPRIILNYLKYYEYDYKTDIFFFNLNTLKFLHETYIDNVLLKNIKDELISDNKQIKRLSKELLLEPENIKSKYSGEFIIDYF